jgi:glycosyltransferase involved in cell wall biosynthesis
MVVSTSAGDQRLFHASLGVAGPGMLGEAVPHKMKVLVFTSLYPNNVWPNHGVFIKERMVHFARLNGAHLRVLAPVPYYPPLSIGSRQGFARVARREVRDGLEVYHPRFVMTPKIGMAFYGLMMFLSVIRTAKTIQREIDFDLIDAHYLFPDGFAAVLLGRVLDRPVVVSARGSDINQFAAFPVIRRCLRFTLRRADKVIAVSQALKDAMTRLDIPGEKISVIPNGVDIGKFYPLSRDAARDRLNLPPGKMMLSVGGLTPTKRFDLLIKALKMLLDDYHEKDLYLVIVGEGKSRNQLKGLVSSLQLDDHVRFMGAIPHQEMYVCYSAADLFCLTSEREGWPNVILESLACGTPVVATNVGGVPEIIRSDEVGLLTKRNERDIAQTILRALHKPWRSESLVQYAQGQAWDKAAQALYHLFESVLAGRAGS